MNSIRESLFFAHFYNALGVPLAAGVLYPAFGLLLNPMIAAAAMSFISVLVIVSALRLKSAKLSLVLGATFYTQAAIMELARFTSTAVPLLTHKCPR